MWSSRGNANLKLTRDFFWCAKRHSKTTIEEALWSSGTHWLYVTVKRFIHHQAGVEQNIQSWQQFNNIKCWDRHMNSSYAPENYGFIKNENIPNVQMSNLQVDISANGAFETSFLNSWVFHGTIITDTSRLTKRDHEDKPERPYTCMFCGGQYKRGWARQFIMHMSYWQPC